MLALRLIPGIGDLNARKLIAWCGSAAQVFSTPAGKLRRIPGIGEVLAKTVRSSQVLDRAGEELAFCERHHIEVLAYLDQGYPARLKECDDGPLILFKRGSGTMEARRVLAVVGTRKATDYGITFCDQMIEELTAGQVTIISGLAYGIDAAAHRAALQHGLPTFGVLAHGHDRIYPYNHRRLAQRMLNGGGLVTEFLSREIPERMNFPRRNRIIAGLSDAILVVEAAHTGGALITAEIAGSYNRDVFAIPGRVGDPFSEGCLNLIKTNKAALVTSGRDILQMMNWDQQGEPGGQLALFPALDPLEEKVISTISPAGAHIDIITVQLGLPPGKVSSLLLDMEFRGLVRVLPGNRFAPAVRRPGGSSSVL